MPAASSLSHAAELLETARAALDSGRRKQAAPLLEQALDTLTRLRPTPERDRLLAHAHLGLSQVRAATGQSLRAEQHLRWGVSYARTCGDAAVRQHAQGLWERWQATP